MAPSPQSFAASSKAARDDDETESDSEDEVFGARAWNKKSLSSHDVGSNYSPSLDKRTSRKNSESDSVDSSSSSNEIAPNFANPPKGKNDENHSGQDTGSSFSQSDDGEECESEHFAPEVMRTQCPKESSKRSPKNDDDKESDSEDESTGYQSSPSGSKDDETEEAAPRQKDQEEPMEEDDEQNDTYSKTCTVDDAMDVEESFSPGGVSGMNGNRPAVASRGSKKEKKNGALDEELERSEDEFWERSIAPLLDSPAKVTRGERPGTIKVWECKICAHMNHWKLYWCSSCGKRSGGKSWELTWPPTAESTLTESVDPSESPEGSISSDKKPSAKDQDDETEEDESILPDNASDDHEISTECDVMEAEEEHRGSRTSDGSFVPRRPPIKKRDGTFARPCGRAPHGMVWDAVRGVYNPKSKSRSVKKAVSKPSRMKKIAFKPSPEKKRTSVPTAVLSRNSPMSLGELLQYGCGDCVNCSKTDCGECASCLSNHRQVCIQKMCCEIPVDNKVQPIPSSLGFPAGFTFVIDPTMPGHEEKCKKAQESQNILAVVDGLKIFSPTGKEYYSVEGAKAHYTKSLADVSPEAFYKHIGVLPVSSQESSPERSSAAGIGSVLRCICDNCRMDACGRCAACRNNESDEPCFQKMCFKQSIDEKAKPAVGFPAEEGWRFYFDKEKLPLKAPRRYERVPCLFILSEGGKLFRSVEAAVETMKLENGSKIARDFYKYVGLSTRKQSSAAAHSGANAQAKTVKRSRMLVTTNETESGGRPMKQSKRGAVAASMKSTTAIESGTEIGSRVYAEWGNGQWYWATIMGITRSKDSDDYQYSLYFDDGDKNPKASRKDFFVEEEMRDEGKRPDPMPKEVAEVLKKKPTTPSTASVSLVSKARPARGALSLRQLYLRRCKKCEHCTVKPDCGACVSCKHNEASAGQERDVCVQKMCLDIADEDKKQVAVGLPEGFSFLFKEDTPRVGGGPPHVPGLFIFHPGGNKFFRSVEAVLLFLPKFSKDNRNAKTIFNRHIGLDSSLPPSAELDESYERYAQDENSDSDDNGNSDNFLVGRQLCFGFSDLKGQRKLLYGTVAACEYDVDKVVACKVTYSNKSRAMVNSMKNGIASTVPASQNMRPALAIGACMRYEEQSGQVMNRLSDFVDPPFSWTWLTPDMRHESVIKDASGNVTPRLTMSLGGYQLVLSVKPSPITNAGYGVFLSCIPLTDESDDSDDEMEPFQLQPGELVDLGIYAPCLIQDRKPAAVFYVKNFIHSFKPEEWSFETKGSQEDNLDITDEVTGDLHEIAKTHVLPYMNETSDQASVCITPEHDPEGSVHLLLGHANESQGPFVWPCNGQEEEIFMYYGDMYERVRVRKGYSFLPDEKVQSLTDADSLGVIKDFRADAVENAVNYMWNLFSKHDGSDFDEDVVERALLCAAVLERRTEQLFIAAGNSQMAMSVNLTKLLKLSGAVVGLLLDAVADGEALKVLYKESVDELLEELLTQQSYSVEDVRKLGDLIG